MHAIYSTIFNRNGSFLCYTWLQESLKQRGVWRIEFYTLPFRNEELLKTWLALICRSRNEVTIHSRICSTHFAGGIKKNDSLLQVFPWQKCLPTQISAPAMIPSDIVDRSRPLLLLTRFSVTFYSTTSRIIIFVSEFEKRCNFVQNAIFVTFQPTTISSQ